MITEVRRFNRTVTHRVGALSDRYLARDHTLGTSRVLWEIGTEGCEARTLRARLGLDSGQTSRTRRILQQGGLVALSPSPADARIRWARLTAAGLRERALLDDRSDAYRTDPGASHPNWKPAAPIGSYDWKLRPTLETVLGGNTSSARRCRRARNWWPLVSRP